MPKRTRTAAMEKSNTPFQDLRRAFRVYNQTTGKSPHTVKWYESRLELFERWLGPDAALGQVTVANVRGYVAELQERTERHVNNPYFKDKSGPLSSSYINGFVRALRAFASWLCQDGYTDTNVLAPVKPPKIQQKVVEPLTDEEVGRLVAIFNPEDAFGTRNFAIVWTLLDCGLRASELCGLQLADAHIEQGYLKVLGKGNKERLVPIGQRCQDALLRWRNRCRVTFDFNDSPYFFLSASGTALTVTALENLILRAGKQARVERIHCHLLRHTFATNYLVKEVGDPLRLQQILGHTSLEMVRRYVAMANLQKSLVDRRSSPMDLLTSTRPASRHGRRRQPRRVGRLRVVK